MLLDQDDLLTPDALGEIALCIHAQPEADVYSDDDKIDSTGRRFAAVQARLVAPELLLGYMYFSHVFAVRRELYAKVGGMRAGFEGSQDYDFALRATEGARAMTAIATVSLARAARLDRSVGRREAREFRCRPAAVQDALQRRGVDALARTGTGAKGQHRHLRR